MLASHWETMLRGCHDDVSHLGLKCMLDLMYDCFIWPQMAIQANKNIEKCHQCIIFKAKQQWAPMECIMATHLLELVHINYICLEPGKGKEENVLVMTDPLGQLHSPLQVTQEDPLIPGKKFSKHASS